MSLPTLIHDKSEFPIVRFHGADIYPGYAHEWCLEMDTLAAGSKPFVLVYFAGGPEETQQDRVQRGAWLKQHKDMLKGKLLALIHVDHDANRRGELENMLPKLVLAFGTPQAACASSREAESLALRVLAGDMAGVHV